MVSLSHYPPHTFSMSNHAEGDFENLETRLLNLERALLGESDQAGASQPGTLGGQIGSLVENAAADDAREPAEKLSEVSALARECASAIDQIERRVIELNSPESQRQQLLVDRVAELRDQVYQALREMQQTRQSELHQGLMSNLATLLDDARSSLPKPSSN